MSFLRQDNIPYLQGKTAHQQGFRFEDNPHIIGSEEFESWINGWIDAMTVEEMDIGEEF
jgi:hypothetical protein